MCREVGKGKMGCVKSIKTFTYTLDHTNNQSTKVVLLVCLFIFLYITFRCIKYLLIN